MKLKSSTNVCMCISKTCVNAQQANTIRVWRVFMPLGNRARVQIDHVRICAIARMHDRYVTSTINSNKQSIHL